MNEPHPNSTPEPSKHDDRGVSLIESAVALVMVSLAVLGWLGAMQTASARAIDREHRENAQTLMFNAVEAVRAFKCDLLIGWESAEYLTTEQARCAPVNAGQVEAAGTTFTMDSEITWVGQVTATPGASCEHYIPTDGWGSNRPTQLARTLTVGWEANGTTRSVQMPVFTAFPASLWPELGDESVGALVVSNTTDPVTLIRTIDGEQQFEITRDPDEHGCVWFPYLSALPAFDYSFRVEDGRTSTVQVEMDLPHTARFNASGTKTNDIPVVPEQIINAYGGIEPFCLAFPSFCPQPGQG